MKQQKLLSVSEHFYSIQGEGANTGVPAYFVRLTGCNVRCPWCDSPETWSGRKGASMSAAEIAAAVAESGAVNVVITGGEPLLHDLSELTEILSCSGKKILLETSGTVPFSGVFDWVCISPKKILPPLEENYALAQELKVVIADESDFLWAEECASKVNGDCRLFLQPEWNSMTVPLVVEYIKSHPHWRLSLQTHKFINVR